MILSFRLPEKYILPLYCILPLWWAGKPTLQPKPTAWRWVEDPPYGVFGNGKNAWATKLPTLLH
ncbi:MAG: hypothetical protein IKZ88_02790 [Neisseriaceae bacterium]|nr:hypothetical protein [Neisseriaceae bacterium]